VLEQEVAKGHFHPFKERKGKRPLRYEKLKLKRTKTCTRSALDQHLSKVLRDSRLKACQVQEQITKKLRTDSTFARKESARSAEVKNLFKVQR
jgi:hypothetical protein